MDEGFDDRTELRIAVAVQRHRLVQEANRRIRTMHLLNIAALATGFAGGLFIGLFTKAVL